MNPIRQTACYLIVILTLSCLAQGELLWLADGLGKQMPSEQEAEDGFEQYRDTMELLWQELTWFPVPLSDTNDRAATAFENSWMTERTYGGTRGHEGTDIMPATDESGYYPVVSMTDGVIEKMGWLEKGGWRIGVRSPNGNYYYYAHLDSYAGDIRQGKKVSAGDLLGYMGDSGYGPEGTAGQFPVHLHVGVYVPLGADREMAVNPYWMLKYLEDKKLSYSY